MSGGTYAALAYGVVFVVVLAYVAIIAAKLERLRRETAELARSAGLPGSEGDARGVAYADSVPAGRSREEEAT